MSPENEKTLREAKERNEKFKSTIVGLKMGIEDLRLQIKYLVFDLEATRRENDELRYRLLDEEIDE
jgi:predicted  nucleic acid-binding Zn-ribbon protein